jgi:hypothetical protein
MSIAGISSNTNIYQDPKNKLQSVKEDFSGLTTSLASGDLSAAQTAFTTLMQDLGANRAQSGQQTGAASQVSTDLTAVGTALNSGDLSDAQNAFATLMQDLKARALNHHHHHHRHSSSAQNTTGTFSTDLTSLGAALTSGDLTAAQKAFASLMQDIGNNGAQTTTAAGSTSTQPFTNGRGNSTASLFDALQTTNDTSQNGSGSSVTTLFQALSVYAHVGQFPLNLPAVGFFSAIGQYV